MDTASYRRALARMGKSEGELEKTARVAYVWTTTLFAFNSSHSLPKLRLISVWEMSLLSFKYPIVIRRTDGQTKTLMTETREFQMNMTQFPNIDTKNFKSCGT